MEFDSIARSRSSKSLLDPVHEAPPPGLLQYSKAVYLIFIILVLSVMCLVITMRANNETYSIEADRARANKVSQVKALGALLSSILEMIPDYHRRVSTITDMCNKMNLQHLPGTLEVMLLRYTECKATQGSCKVEILTSLRGATSCPIVDREDGVGEYACKIPNILPVAKAVLAGEEGSLVSRDYAGDISIFAYRLLPEINVGLVLRQNQGEAARSQDIVIQQRLFGGLTVFIMLAALILILLVILTQIQQGAGYLHIALLALTATLGCLTLVFLVVVIGSRGEGSQQQRMEVSHGTSILTAGCKAMLNVGTHSMRVSTLKKWMAGTNAILGDETRVVGMMNLSGTLIHLTDYPTGCDGCARWVEEQLQETRDKLPLMFEGRLFDGTPGFYAKEVVKLGVERDQVGLIWTTQRNWVTAPYKSLTDDLWNRAGACIAVYIILALTASYLVAVYMPRDHGLAEPLSMLMPAAVVLGMSIPLLFTIYSSTESIDSMEKAHEVQSVKIHAAAAKLHVVQGTAELHAFQDLWVDSLINPDAAATQRLEDRKVQFQAHLNNLSHHLRWITGEKSVEAQVVGSISTVFDGLVQHVVIPGVAKRSEVDLHSNRTYIEWVQFYPSSQHAALVSDFASIKQWLRAMGVAANSSLMQDVLLLESMLSELEIMHRIQVVCLCTPNYTAKHAAVVNKFAEKEKHVVASIQALDGSLSSRTIQATLDGMLQRLAFHYDESSRFKLGKEPENILADIIRDTIHSNRTFDLVRLSGTHKVVLSQVQGQDVIDVVNQQLERIGQIASSTFRQHRDLGYQLDLYDDLLERLLIVPLVTIAVVWLLLDQSFIFYMRKAVSNVSPDGSKVRNYPQSEVVDFRIWCVVVMTILALEAVVQYEIGKTEAQELREKDDTATKASSAGEIIGEWNGALLDLATSFSTYALTTRGTDKEKHMRAVEAIEALLTKDAADTSGREVIGSAPIQPHYKQMAFTAIQRTPGILTSLKHAEGQSRPIHSYASLALLTDRMSEDPKNMEFVKQLYEGATMKYTSREEWLSTVNSSQWSVVDVAYDSRSSGEWGWQPRTLRFESEGGYQLRWTNRHSQNGVTVNLTRLMRNVAIGKVSTANAVWDVPEVDTVYLPPQQEVNISLVAVLSGAYPVLDQNRKEVMTIVITKRSGPPRGVARDLSADVTARLGDPRRAPSHPVWEAAVASHIGLPATGGFRPVPLLWAVDTPIYLSVDTALDGCQWVAAAQDTACDEVVRKELGSLESREQCGVKVPSDPDCSTSMVTNGTDCHCVRVGRQCKKVAGSTGYTLYDLRCEAPSSQEPLGIDLWP
eukprot:Sspe_Gene.66660::Locus_39375_Transcript_1_1_Confidence_1.000_Length_4002::g.66660::m.66660